MKWKGKRAAVTLTFDDGTEDHIKYVAPALNERGLHGTFFVVPQIVGQKPSWMGFNMMTWEDIQALFDVGHEIGSHTYNHAGMSLEHQTEKDMRLNLERTIKAIRENVSGCSEVPSFSYPGGVYDEAGRKIVLDYHQSGRCSDRGFNFKETLDLGLLKPKSTPGKTVSELNSLVDEAINRECWLIEIIHRVNVPSDPYNTPLEVLEDHWDYVVAHREDLWVATQQQVVEYLKALSLELVGYLIAGCTPLFIITGIVAAQEWKKHYNP